jgi:bifunctional DNA-binding transcriptional regulator/antitoxin component of YhaV-PrlF toxin-antitoxin module
MGGFRLESLKNMFFEFFHGGKVEQVLRVDEKGRVLLPGALRKKLGINRLVKARIEGNRIILEPVADPVELLMKTVIEGTEDIELEISELRRTAENQVKKLIEE